MSGRLVALLSPAPAVVGVTPGVAMSELSPPGVPGVLDGGGVPGGVVGGVVGGVLGVGVP